MKHSSKGMFGGDRYQGSWDWEGCTHDDKYADEDSSYGSSDGPYINGILTE